MCIWRWRRRGLFLACLAFAHWPRNTHTTHIESERHQLELRARTRCTTRRSRRIYACCNVYTMWWSPNDRGMRATSATTWLATHTQKTLRCPVSRRGDWRLFTCRRRPEVVMIVADRPIVVLHIAPHYILFMHRGSRARATPCGINWVEDLVIWESDRRRDAFRYAEHFIWRNNEEETYYIFF